MVSPTAVRPADLPDFLDPPLNEVVLGVQFESLKGYQQIRAGEVWSLYRARYPKVQERPSLPPTFETFGLPSRPVPTLQLVNGPMHDRFWFLTEGEEQLLQFQPDRFLHNWRKVDNESNPYPRFESMISRFEEELQTLEHFVGKLEPQSLQINQCEITYINHIVPKDGQQLKADDWLSVVGFGGAAVPEGMSLSFTEVVRDEADKPTARLTVEAMTGLKPPQTAALLLNLTVRGAPNDSSISSAVEFLTHGRRSIVNAFARITSESAHQLWKRVQ
jgi:uncharacterized protein (TIGR04255 family)